MNWTLMMGIAAVAIIGYGVYVVISSSHDAQVLEESNKKYQIEYQQLCADKPKICLNSTLNPSSEPTQPQPTASIPFLNLDLKALTGGFVK